MKELIIKVNVSKDQVATIVKKEGFDNSISSSYEIIGIMQNIIRIEQDKMLEHSDVNSLNLSNNGEKK